MLILLRLQAEKVKCLRPTGSLRNSRLTPWSSWKGEGSTLCCYETCTCFGFCWFCPEITHAMYFMFSGCQMCQLARMRTGRLDTKAVGKERLEGAEGVTKGGATVAADLPGGGDVASAKALHQAACLGKARRVYCLPRLD